jgi:Tol biopolymer transport system component
LQLLVGGPETDLAPAWSPEGSAIVFVRLADDHGQLFVVDPAGGTPRPLTDGSADDGSPTWSPDGHWVAFIRRSPRGLSTLYVVDANDLHLVPLVEVPSDYERLTWSPSGNRIAFTTHRDGNAEVYVRDVPVSFAKP